MSELDDLERDLLEASSVWFSQHLHLKLQRLIAIARDGERATALLRERIEKENPLLPAGPGRISESPGFTSVSPT
jgi:hypothetical protein